MSGSTLFTDAMALTQEGDGVYHGELNEHWTIGPEGHGPKVHGGAMLALCASAARTEHSRGQERSDSGDQRSDGVQPIAVSGNFLWAPDPGPMRVVTTVRKRGRRVSLIDVEVRQGVRSADERSHEEQEEQRVADERSHEEQEEQRVAVRAAVTLGEPEHHVPPLLSVNPVVPLMTPEPPPGLEPIGPGHPMADIVHLAHGCDIRPALATMEPRSDGGPPVIEYWVRPKGVAPDVLFALLCGDVSAPVTFAVNRFGWAPTVQLTAYLRALPADGWLRVMCTTVQIGQDWFDEDRIVVDCEGRIIVQSRQLAMVPPAQ
jgi:acyl-coenzyme A thioesterase PaaI-like protein